MFYITANKEATTDLSTLLSQVDTTTLGKYLAQPLLGYTSLFVAI